MPAFQHAVDLGYRYLETDVHATSDGVLLAFHDHELDRVTNHSGQISELLWDDVKHARVDGTQPIARLDELLSSFPEARLNIDIKAQNSIRPLVDTIIAHDAIDRVCVGSFSDRRLSEVRDLMGPRLCTSLGPLGVAALRAASFGTPSAVPRVGCAQVSPMVRNRTLLDERFVAAAAEHDLPIHVWTIDDEAEMNRLLDLGVAGIMTDKPQVLKDVLVARNAWT